MTQKRRSSDLFIGMEVELSGLGNGLIMFIGETSFANGEWIGVELQTPSGKNDGSVQGVRYFSCSENHGCFVRRSQLMGEKYVSSSPAEKKPCGISPDQKLNRTRTTTIKKSSGKEQNVSRSRSSLSNVCISLTNSLEAEAPLLAQNLKFALFFLIYNRNRWQTLDFFRRLRQESREQ